MAHSRTRLTDKALRELITGFTGVADTKGLSALTGIMREIKPASEIAQMNPAQIRDLANDATDVWAGRGWPR